MKKLFLALTAILLLSFAPVSSFSEGFEDGFCEGFKFVKGQYTVCPVAPVAPVPQVGQNTYKGGYNLGFTKGKIHAKNN